MSEREKILAALSAFIRQRPGLEFGNYGDVSAYRSEMRSITKDRHDAEALLAAVSWRDGIGAEELKEAFRAYSGRLSWDGERLSYCTGQYFPTEYRKAVCAVLASALWSHIRDHCMPEPEYSVGGRRRFLLLDDAKEYAEAMLPIVAAIEKRYDGKTAGDWLRSYFRKEFGSRLARRWLD